MNWWSQFTAPDRYPIWASHNNSVSSFTPAMNLFLWSWKTGRGENGLRNPRIGSPTPRYLRDIHNVVYFQFNAANREPRRSHLTGELASLSRHPTGPNGQYWFVYRQSLPPWDLRLLIAVNMETPCCLVEVYRHFGPINCIHLQDWRVNQAEICFIFGWMFDPEDGSSTFVRYIYSIYIYYHVY
jgi:hypothetical protein